MGRPPKEQKILNCRLEKNVYDVLMGYSLVSGKTKTSIVEQAILDYVNKKNTEKAIVEQFYRNQKTDNNSL